ncbi:hypothetical protein HMPREF0091_10374 [Fannyhessea vaginae DSM 15829]|uniref:Uncharacterized protein n=1 Tax=Fannyhessea vaginae DSM 15829 TaxID=525256 RepID=F1T3Y3_9ACTN|nr:hypothetical protein HMPREF0091_10374 [Fannyhessea vaginae DSM 15829]
MYDKDRRHKYPFCLCALLTSSAARVARPSACMLARVLLRAWHYLSFIRLT